MKRILASFGWMILLLPLLSYAGTKRILAAATADNVASEKRQVSGFTAVAASGAFDVFIKFGATETLLIEGDEEQTSKIETRVESGVLKIYYKSGSFLNLKRTKKATVYITAKSLKSLTVSGSGDMKVSGTIRSSKLDTKVSGSGSISFSADVSSLNALISGSGSIHASGVAKTTDIIISGSGGFKGEDLRTTDSDIKVSGSGEARIHADKSINAVVSGSGNIYYSGSPVINQVKSGSGRISHI